MWPRWAASAPSTSTSSPANRPPVATVLIDITMPRLSDSMEEGVVARWLVQVGSAVERGQPIAEIDTDKATMELEAEASGTVVEILVAEGESAPIGAPLARLGRPEETPASALSPAAAEEGGRPRARPGVSPVARRLAAELGVDLASVTGSGPGGLITREDVQRAAGATGVAAPAIKGEVRVEEPTRVQRLIARRMAEGSSVPTFAVETEIDMTAVTERRGSLAEAAESVPSVNDFLVKAAALALREFPRLNASYTDRGFELYARVNVGIAVAGEDTLVVPTVFDADRKSLAEIAAETRRLAERARAGEITAAELEGGTFTVTNLGMLGVRRFLPIINPPQAAILAVGAVYPRPAVDDRGALVLLPSLSATLVCDHRIVYGAEAARFLSRVKELLEEPQALL